MTVQGVRRRCSAVRTPARRSVPGQWTPQFWALVCEDEEWLQAEFDAIVSEPARNPGAAFRAADRTAAARPAGRRGSGAHPEPPSVAGREPTGQAVAAGTVPSAAEPAPAQTLDVSRSEQKGR